MTNLKIHFYLIMEGMYLKIEKRLKKEWNIYG
jgi:hypothetical protein